MDQPVSCQSCSCSAEQVLFLSPFSLENLVSSDTGLGGSVPHYCIEACRGNNSLQHRLGPLALVVVVMSAKSSDLTKIT